MDNNETKSKVDLSLIDNDMIKYTLKNSIPMMKEWVEAEENYVEDLYEAEDENVTEIEIDVLDSLEMTFKMFSTNLNSDVFSNTNLNLLFDTASITAFVGDVLKYIGLYRQSSVTAKVLANTAIIGFNKVAEYLSSLYIAFDEQGSEVYRNYKETCDDMTNEIIEMFTSDVVKDLVKDSKAYGLSYTDYKNIQVIDETNADGSDNDEDDDDTLDGLSDDGIRSTMNALEFNTGSLLNGRMDI